tara:strand:- start:102042 stop:102587 length:546 start_codon:yes stop_codon:yes gene_type:complete
LFYAVLTHKSSLREVCKNIGLIFLKLIPFGMKQLPSKSTLSDANLKRDHNNFADLIQSFSFIIRQFFRAIGWISAERWIQAGWKSLTLQLRRFKKRARKPLNGKKKGGAKVFAKMNMAEGVPNYICICSEATYENMFLKVMELPEYGIAVFHKGYNRYLCFEKMGQFKQIFCNPKKGQCQL